MPRYVALLRGVSPMNLKMADLKRCLEASGYTQVRTVLASGNVAFDAARARESTLAGQVEAQLHKQLGRSFPVTVRSSAYLRKLLASDPYAQHPVPVGAKRVVTFLHRPHEGELALPLELDGARILAVRGAEAFSAYLPSPKGPVFMTLLKSTFGLEQTTRTWGTVKKCAAA